MADPILARALAPKVKINDKEYEIYITPRDVIKLAKEFQVDVLTRITGVDSFERAASVIAIATHDSEITKDVILDSLSVGQIVQYGKTVLENASAGIEAPKQPTQPTA